MLLFHLKPWYNTKVKYFYAEFQHMINNASRHKENIYEELL